MHATLSGWETQRQVQGFRVGVRIYLQGAVGEDDRGWKSGICGAHLSLFSSPTMREAVSSLSTTTWNSRLPAVTCAEQPQLMMTPKMLQGLHSMRCKDCAFGLRSMKFQA